jgi:hypothetical protein
MAGNVCLTGAVVPKQQCMLLPLKYSRPERKCYWVNPPGKLFFNNLHDVSKIGRNVFFR